MSLQPKPDESESLVGDVDDNSIRHQDRAACAAAPQRKATCVQLTNLDANAVRLERPDVRCGGGPVQRAKADERSSLEFPLWTRQERLLQSNRSTVTLSQRVAEQQRCRAVTEFVVTSRSVRPVVLPNRWVIGGNGVFAIWRHCVGASREVYFSKPGGQRLSPAS